MTDDPTPDPPADEPPPPGSEGRDKRPLAIGLAAAAVVLGVGAVAVVATGGGSCPSGGAVLEANGESISEEALTRRAELVEALYGLKPPEGEKADSYRRELAKSMATALIVEQEAQRRKIAVADRAVRDALDRYIADFFPEGGRDKFVEAMGNKGLSEAEVLAEFRQIQTTFRLLDSAAGDVTVTDAEVARAFEQRQDKLVLPEQRRLRHLVVGSEADANTVLTRLRQGEAFPAVATAVSLDATTKPQGGDLGLRAATDLEEPFRQAAFGATKGQPFGPVQTRFGWHVGLVEEIVAPRPVTREEAIGPIKEQMLAERKLAAQRRYTARMLSDADVCYDSRFRPADPDAPPPETTGTPSPSATTTSGP
jgi:peptidyl-prolyl cis-trans isomerase C